MATSKDRTFLRQFQTLFNLGTIQNLSDGQLLERFAAGGERAELAFAALVERHAVLVLRVCRAQLGDSHDAQDAFQATFLVLMKKAKSLWVRDSIGPWLHQVAFRTASCVRSSEARRRRLERNVAIRESYEPSDREGIERALHEELNRLPDRYRVPIVLCDLQGLSCEEAARRMGRPVGTVKSWRSRGRDRLRQRLVRLGMAPATEIARADPISENTVNLAVRRVTEGMTAGTVPASVGRLVNGVLKAMILGKLRMVAVVMVAGLPLVAGLGAFASNGVRDEPAQAVAPQLEPAKVAAPKVDEDPVWSLTLPKAIRLGLENSDVVRLKVPEPGDDPNRVTLINNNKAYVDSYRFRSELMAHVRSVEQQYWALSLAQVQSEASKTAVDLGEQILKREEAKALGGASKNENVREAVEQLDRFRLDFVDKTSNLITTERQLRRLLGLAPSGGRRIVTATKPSEIEIKPVWEDCMKVLHEVQPDVQRALANVKIAKATNAGDAEIERQETFAHQTERDVEHGMARMFLEIGSNYRLFTTASRLKDAAKQRLDAQAALFESGKITIDRYLDAVNRWATATSQEAEYKARYNTAIVALEEAKGSLLDVKGIVIADTPRVASLIAHDGAVEPAMFPHPEKSPNGPAHVAQPAKEEAGKTYSFQFSIGGGPKPVEIKGSFTVPPTEK